MRQTLDGINNQYSWLQWCSGKHVWLQIRRVLVPRWPCPLSLGVARGACAFVLSITMHLKAGIFTLLLLWSRLKLPVFLGAMSQALSPAPLPRLAEDVPWFPPNMTPAIKTNYSSIMSPILVESCSDGWDFFPCRISGDQLEGPLRPFPPNGLDWPEIVQNSSKRWQPLCSWNL